MSFGSQSLPAPTVDEQHRIAMAKDHGCVCCRLRFRELVLGEYHHVLSGGRRVGHRFGFVLCPWHHRGEVHPKWTEEDMIRKYGPSMYRSSRYFELRFGTQQSLLDYQDQLIGWPQVKINRPVIIYRAPRKIVPREGMC